MELNTIKAHTEVHRMNVGPFKVKQPLPNTVLDQYSPFLLLHHAGPDQYAPGEIKSRLSPHPHRGFEPVTFLISGSLHHKDSTGAEGFLNGGDVQWMTSGSGIIHSEGPTAEFAEKGGEMELIQLWVNLPRDHKMTTPKYQDIKKASMPMLHEEGFSFTLVAGDFKDQKGPASTFTPMVVMMVSFEKGAKTIIPLDENFHTMLYVLDGEIEANGVKLETYHLGLAENDGDAIELLAASAGKLLFLSGEPINEPLAAYGPFVMNYQGEIRQAVLDFESGKMGVLES
jgi:quercetin 2,3-dioxygenase